jgi:hypothetical protein
MKIQFSFIGVVILLLTGYVLPQETPRQSSIFPAGLSVEYGLGKYSVRDEYISKEKYSGILPSIKTNWSRLHNKYIYHLSLEYRSSSEITNYNVSTNIYQFALNQGYLYPLSKVSIFNKDLYAFLGPSAELYFFFNRQNIAVFGFDYTQSIALLLSSGLNSEVILPLRKNLQAEGSLNLSILSLGFRMVDFEEDDAMPVKLLTFLSGTNAALRLGIRYDLVSNFSLKLAYQFQLARISAWDPLLAASDNLIITLTYKL